MRTRANLICCAILALSSCTFDVPVGTSQPTPPLRPSGDSASSAATTTPAVSQAALADTPRPQSPISDAPPGPKPPDTEPKPKVGDDWPMFGRDYAHTSSSVNTSLKSDSWLFPLWEHESAAVTATPAIHSGVAYYGDWDGTLHAVNLTDGKMVWESKLGAGVVSTAFVTEDTVYVADREGSVHAFDRREGKERWRAKLGNNETVRLWSSPILIDDTIVIGLSGFARAGQTLPPPTVVGLDAKTGMQRWSTDAADSTHFPVRGAALWMWSTAAVDTTRNLAFLIGGRSNAPFVGWDRIISIDYKTGQFQWLGVVEEAQVDAPTSDGTEPFTNEGVFHPDMAPLLFSVKQKGSTLDFIAVPSRSGQLHAFTPEGGPELWTTQIRGGSEADPFFTPNEVDGTMLPLAFADGLIFAGYQPLSGPTRFVAVDAMTGDRVWVDEVDSTFSLGGLLSANDAVVATGSHIGDPADGGGALLFHEFRSGMLEQFYGGLTGLHNGGGMSVSGNILLVGFGHAFDRAQNQPGGVAAIVF